MIGSLKGIITYIFTDHILLDVSGVGYQVFLSSKSLASLSKGETVFIFVHTHVREDDISLFGFASEQDKNMFLTLNKVNGVGVKTALNVLSMMTSDEIIDAILFEDVKSFTAVSGIGNKAAQRIVNELKDQVAKMSKDSSIVTISRDNKEKGSEAASYSLLYDAISALENLGYQKTQIIEIVKEVCKDEDELSNVITKSLQIISSK